MEKIDQRKMIITIDYDVTDDHCNCYISQDGTSGCEYNVSSIEDITEAVANYIENYAIDESESSDLDYDNDDEW